jgi:uncharacterized phage protein gp47/JayE
MIPAPIILYPKTNWSTTGDQVYYSDALLQSISGDIPVIPGEIITGIVILLKYRYKIDRSGVPGVWSVESSDNVSVGTSNTVVTSIPWSFYTEGLFDLYSGDVLTMEFKAYKVSNILSSIGEIIDYSDYSSIVAHIVLENEITTSADPLTGMKLRRYKDNIKLMVPASGIIINEDNDFSGCNFYMSLIMGTGYVLINDVPITAVDSTETEDILLTESSYEDSVNNLTITTTKTRQATNEFYTFTLDKSVLAKLVQQGKIPNIFLADGQTISNDIIYYMISTVRTFDKALNQLVESPYSQELEGQFLAYSTDYQNLPKRSRSDVLFSLSREMMVNNNLIKVVPGTVIRDLSDPVSLEFEKMYVIQDFIFSCLSLDTLVAFDDADGDGISDPVSTNIRKKTLASALGLKDPTNLQILIDEQFNKYAANSDLTRKGPFKSVGVVVFYTEIRPTNDLLIMDNTIVSTPSDQDNSISLIKFVVRGTIILSADSADTYYNPTAKRYEIQANIEAQIAGSSGNVPAESIKVALNVSPSLRVINEVPTRYGYDRETNQQLADRIKTAKFEYDSGTEGGYNATAMDVPGVIQARVEIAGDPLMMRDYETSDKKHFGGKVDIYIRGTRILQMVDQVAFSYEYPTDTYGNKVGESFYVSDATDFRLRCKSTKVNADNPIVSVSKIRNLTRGKDYSLVNIQIIGEGDTLLLNKDQQNLNIGLATFDVVEVAYLYRSSNLLVLSQQPVESIVSVITSGGTTIDTSKYRLVKYEDPLLNGGSSIAQDAVKFFFKESDNIQDFIAISNEEHDMLYDTPARLVMKGVDVNSIVVAPVGGGTVFIKDVDYSVILGSDVSYTFLELLYYSKIRHGDRVSVSYNASENFNVTFTTNDLVKQVQDKADIMKHACGDAVAKQAIRNFVDISFVVIRKTGTDINLLKSRIITTISNYVAKLKMGDTLTQSSISNEVRKVEGVKDLRIPFTRMMKRNSSFIPLDPVGLSNFEVYNKASASGITSYRSIDSVLTYKTSDNGGDSNYFRGVYENNIPLTLTSSPIDVSKGSGRAYIQSDGKIIVSTTDGAPPQTKFYKASYFTYYPADENPVGDIETSEIEYLDVDSLSLRDIEIIDEKVNKRGF